MSNCLSISTNPRSSPGRRGARNATNWWRVALSEWLARPARIARLSAILLSPCTGSSVIADFGLDAGPETLRYPDIVVDRTGGAAGDYVATAPVLLAEVLSPTTAEIDLGDKAAEYLRLPSLLSYLVFAQSGHKAYVWTRNADGFPPAPSVIVGRDKIIRIAVLNLALPMGAVYAGVENS
jgi:Uma2 family endonuclease